MRTTPWLLLVALVACVGDSSQADGGGDASTNDAPSSDVFNPDVNNSDASTNCIFGSSHFDDGCRFAP